MAVKIIHIADIHMGRGFRTASFGRELGTKRRREIKESLIRVVKRCEDEAVDLLLIAGDLFEEEYVSLSELKDLNHSFSKLTRTKVVISAGNHDPIMNHNANYKLTKWCKQVYVFETKMSSIYFESLNTQIYSASWNQKYLPAFEVGELNHINENRINILMLHGDAYNRGDYMYIDKRLIEPLGFDYIALGHIHAFEKIMPNMAYSGSLEPLDFSETGKHGIIEGTIGKKEVNITFKQFSKRSFQVLNIEVDGTMSYESIKEVIKSSLSRFSQEDMFRINLNGLLDQKVDLDLKHMKQGLEEMVHYIEIKDNTVQDLDIEQLSKDYEGTLIGAYITYITNLGLEDPVVSQALYDGLRILLEEQVMV